MVIKCPLNTISKYAIRSSNFDDKIQVINLDGSIYSGTIAGMINSDKWNLSSDISLEAARKCISTDDTM